jgi:hypothetical protein
MKYKKKPIVIEAIQWHGASSFEALYAFADADNNHGVVGHDGDNASIRTLEGIMTASVGDYIIKGIKGELYPCKPDIFEMTYDKVEDGDFKSRLKEEYNQVLNNCNKLSEFIFAGNFKSLDSQQQSLLRIQLVTMRAYETCLIQRLHEIK